MNEFPQLNAGSTPRKPIDPFVGGFLQVLSLAIASALAYHGYKRNNSVGWAIFWAIIGGAFWPIAVPVALAQGFGQERKDLPSGLASRRP